MDPTMIQPQTAQTAPVAPATPAEPSVPQEVRDRTRREFEELLESNKRLFEANQLLRKEVETRPTQTPVAPQAQTQPVKPQVNPQDFVEVGPDGERYVNEDKLKAKMEEINAKAARAEQLMNNYVQQAQERERQTQTREAFTAYPELNPEDKGFNSELNKQVRGVLLDAMYNPSDWGGRPLTFKEAADFVKKQTLPQQPAPVATPSADGQALKEQAAAQANSEPAVARPTLSDDADLALLQKKTRTGDNEALARRLMHTEHIVKPDMS